MHMVRTGGADQRILLSAQTAKQRVRFTQSGIAQETGAPLKRFLNSIHKARRGA